MQRLFLLFVIALVGACARVPVAPVGVPGLPDKVELTEVSFFPQEDYQCGPAALATMLTQRGIETSPELLVDRVYLPGRKGSLQVEMVAAARAHDLLVYPLEPKLEAILSEVAAGNPVLVLQNLAFDRWPQWHFAVVVGYDLAAQVLVLRSGTKRRWLGTFSQFERSWAKGDRWAVVTVQPGNLPTTAKETIWLKAASDLEQTDRQDAALQAYKAATDHWNSGLAWFALANAHYAQGDRQASERALRNSVKYDNKFAAGWYNLSQVLAEEGCSNQAIAARACAAKLAPDDKRFGAELSIEQNPTRVCATLPMCPIR